MKQRSIQDSQYSFPYHYIPHFRSESIPSVTRSLYWGLEYLCYQTHVREMVLSVTPDTILEVGCGDGNLIGNLGDTIRRRVGVDLSSRAIAFARAFWPDCEFYDSALEEIDGVFDVVAAIEVLEHIPDDEVTDTLQAMISRIRYGGYLIVSVPSVNVPANPKHYRHYSEESLRKQVDQTGANLHWLKVDHIYHEPFWLRKLLRVMFNGFVTLEIRPVMKILWRIIWNRYRISSPNHGRHIVALIQRV